LLICGRAGFGLAAGWQASANPVKREPHVTLASTKRRAQQNAVARKRQGRRCKIPFGV
jgi:hypothetical protein